jgi:tRNA threonylcarbamoyl adenosine modification protein YjeE
MSTADAAEFPPLERDLKSAEATEAFAARVATALMPGDRVLLLGDLGAGKTTFVRGLVRGLRSDRADEVASPTFALHHRYPGGRMVVDHCDLYRLKPGVDLSAEGLDDVVDDRSNVVCVEWPERLGARLLGAAFEIELIGVGETRRLARVRPITSDAARRLAEAAP